MKRNETAWDKIGRDFFRAPRTHIVIKRRSGFENYDCINHESNHRNRPTIDYQQKVLCQHAEASVQAMKAWGSPGLKAGRAGRRCPEPATRSPPYGWPSLLRDGAYA